MVVVIIASWACFSRISVIRSLASCFRSSGVRRFSETQAGGAMAVESSKRVSQGSFVECCRASELGVR